MPKMITDLTIDRVDLVEEGANSAAFIRLYKSRGEKMNYESILKSLKPEHAAVVEAEVAKAKEALDTANQTIVEKEASIEALNTKVAELEEAAKKKPCKKEDDMDDNDDKCDGSCNKSDKTSGSASFDETEVVKSMPEEARQLFAKMRMQKEAAEEELRKAKEAEADADAKNKAAMLKSLPIEQSELVDFIKANPTSFDMLNTIAAAIDGAVFNEVGKSKEGSTFSTTSNDAWGQIEKEAKAIAASDGITEQAAVARVIKEKPELYKQYLEGGAN